MAAPAERSGGLSRESWDEAEREGLRVDAHLEGTLSQEVVFLRVRRGGKDLEAIRTTSSWSVL